MTNESKIALPPNIEDKTVLKRFLSVVIQEIDEIKGRKGNSSIEDRLTALELKVDALCTK